MDKCYRTKEIHQGPFGTDLLTMGLDRYFIINRVGLYKYLPAVIILPYFIYDFNGGDSFYQIVTAVLYNAGKNKQLWMTKPSQGCLNALQYLLCTIGTSLSHMWIMVIYEWWAICEWQCAKHSHPFLSERSFSSVYFREGCVMQVLSNNQSKRTVMNHVLFEICIYMHQASFDTEYRWVQS